MRIAFAAILLGMGEHEVAVGFDSIRRDSSINLVLNVNATKHQLKSAPAWRWDTTKSSVDTRGECPSELSSFDVKQLCSWPTDLGAFGLPPPRTAPFVTLSLPHPI